MEDANGWISRPHLKGEVASRRKFIPGMFKSSSVSIADKDRFEQLLESVMKMKILTNRTSSDHHSGKSLQLMKPILQAPKPTFAPFRSSRAKQDLFTNYRRHCCSRAVTALVLLALGLFLLRRKASNKEIQCVT